MQDLQIETFSTYLHFQQCKFTIILSRQSVMQQISLVRKVQTWSFIIPDVLKNSPSQNSQSIKQGLSLQCDSPLFIVELGDENSQFHQWFWNILQYLTSYCPRDSAQEVSGTFIFHQKCHRVLLGIELTVQL